MNQIKQDINAAHCTYNIIRWRSYTHFAYSLEGHKEQEIEEGGAVIADRAVVPSQRRKKKYIQSRPSKVSNLTYLGQFLRLHCISRHTRVAPSFRRKKKHVQSGPSKVSNLTSLVQFVGLLLQRPFCVRSSCRIYSQTRQDATRGAQKTITNGANYDIIDGPVCSSCTRLSRTQYQEKCMEKPVLGKRSQSVRSILLLLLSILHKKPSSFDIQIHSKPKGLKHPFLPHTKL